MQRRNLIVVAILGAVGLTASGFWIGRVLATGAPTVAPLTYAGTVTDKGGKPYPGEVEVKVAFYDAAVGGNAKCTPDAVKAEAGSGRFEVVLGGECVAAFHATADLWSQTTVGSGADQQVMARSHVGAVPYALEADSAKVALAAGGGLKAGLDALTALVGSGGPWVVDKKGTRIGRFLGSSFNWFNLLTSKGYVVAMTNESLGYYSGFIYAQKGCSGNPGYPAAGTLMNNLAFFIGGTWYTTGGPLDGVTKVSSGVNYYSSKRDAAGKCTDVPSDTQGNSVELKPTAAATIGVPDSIEPPFLIQP